MNTFLRQVAGDLLLRYGNNLSDVTVVFPNRRARLFFNEYLCAASEVPVWAPRYASIDELFSRASGLQLADPFKLLVELYNTYTAVYNRTHPTVAAETFDEFYFFGEILLNDFNDVDKNLVNDMALFSNLAELDKLKDHFEHLESAQWELIQRFFKDINTNRTQLKEAFLSIWNILGMVYSEFRQKLFSENIAYEGMLYRTVVEEIQREGTARFSQEKYIFVGFNVLTECEKALFRMLKADGKALFYWDFDDYYMSETQEAGRFMRDNLRCFGNDLPATEVGTSNFLSSKKSLTIVESSSETAQSGYLPLWLNEVDYEERDAVPDTAIVLCNEQNLQAVMHALPAKTAHGNSITANITMGFPLVQTPVYSLITALADLQLRGTDATNRRFRYNFVLPVLHHPYVRLLSSEASKVQEEITKSNNFFPTADELRLPQVFCPCKSVEDLSAYLVDMVRKVAQRYGEQDTEKDSFSQLYEESLFRAFQTLNRLNDLIAKGDLQLKEATYVSLLKRLLGGISIPFHGEPARGLQLMGVLETRNMDFRNVLLMSVNEGVMPKSDNESSFIPHFIRKAFGMSTVEHQDSLYAYHFYRLLQRAENVVLIYNSANAQTGKMEKSRYLLQLLTESGLPIRRVNLQTEMHPHRAQPLRVEKTDGLLDKMRRQYDFSLNADAQSLSPSALNNYMDCSLRFYLHHIEKIKPPKELSDELDNSVLGRVFHKAVELIYREIGRVEQEQGKAFPAFVVSSEMIEGFLKISARIERAIERAFDEEFFGNRAVPRSRYNGEQLVYFGVVKQFVRRLLEIDKTYAPFTIEALEQPVEQDIAINGMQLRVGGIVDRIDSKAGVLRVVDYKTGGYPKEVSEMDKLFESGKDRANYIFQAFLYSSILVKKQTQAVQPALVYIQKATDTADYSPAITWAKEPIQDFRELAEEFETALHKKLAEVFNPSIAFTQTENTKVCEYCDFREMCGR